LNKQTLRIITIGVIVKIELTPISNFFKLLIFTKKNPHTMSLLNQQNNKGKKKDNKKAASANAKGGSKFIQKPKSTGFVAKQANTGSQRGS
jgi:hypothetical protein